ncbi:MAG: zinc ABC transporter substrate-binding protein [Candidatus Paraimprobicoccus trichonymphae]|uniref:Zinc ABC transporter substrate-binding protein n=1 Tax=Candidatus Paraimprobicoccus trichonymphae TaxID=3033793 RepID=A0AA48L1K9_9FIRM|nr:MAG: zinc ABC transporter substrate-binding protein [Candidatus Paraimprobicoccus trichonymphae]
MKKKNFILFFVLGFLVIFSFVMLFFNSYPRKEFYDGIDSLNEEKKVVVASFYPIYIILLNITDGVENIKIENISKNYGGGCLHDFQLQPTDMKKIEKSMAFVINGAGMEDSFIEKLKENYEKINIIDSSKNINLLHKDSHIWLSLNNYKKQVENILEQLSKIDTKNSEKYILNASEYMKKLEELKFRMENELSKIPIEKRKIVILDNRFNYFGKDFNFETINLSKHSHSHDEGSNAKEISSLIYKIKTDKNIKSIFVDSNSESSKKTAESISKEVSVKIYELNSATNGEKNKDQYLNSVEKNFKTIKNAFNIL